MQKNPVDVLRTPIRRKAILTGYSKMRLKIRELEELSRNSDMLNIKKHYEMLARTLCHRELRLDQGRMAARNGKQVEEIYEICRIKGWDYRLYVEAQFKRGMGVKSIKFSVPPIESFTSVNALRYFTNYLSTLKQSYRHDLEGREKEKGKQTTTRRGEVMEGIIKSVELLDRYSRQSGYTDLAQYKAIRIFQSWEELSPYYLFSIPWFHEILKEDLESRFVDGYREKFKVIQGSTELQDLIKKVVRQVEAHYNLPGNIQLG